MFFSIIFYLHCQYLFYITHLITHFFQETFFWLFGFCHYFTQLTAATLPGFSLLSRSFYLLVGIFKSSLRMIRGQGTKKFVKASSLKKNELFKVFCAKGRALYLNSPKIIRVRTFCSPYQRPWPLKRSNQYYTWAVSFPRGLLLSYLH